MDIKAIFRKKLFLLLYFRIFLQVGTVIYLVITSSANSVFKNLCKLKDKKYRDKNGLFIAEGLRFVRDIPENVFIEEYILAESEAYKFDDLRDGVRTYVFSDSLFGQISDTDSPQGIIAVCRKLKYESSDVFKNRNGFYIIAENINDPGNLGTVIRTADAFNAEAIFLSAGSVDIYNSKVLRSTMGSIFHIPIITGVDINEIAHEMRSRGIALYAAHLKGKKKPQNIDLNKPSAFILGNEARGLSDNAASLCDELIKIPIPGKAESLNLSVAAAVLMYEAVRQRNGR